ncbi:DMT family transporter [Oricola thermophila]|uniref:DMT family transporter n=2 Tax=Oricola thermophila TaxID=2742145 RepID=A0A6N1VHQ8_9HYPH|nr:DMT family transporter [Oricola thermophila]
METAPREAEPRPLAGIALMCAGVASLCISDAIAKELTAGYAVMQVLFMRNLLALPVAVAIAWKLGGRAALRSHKPMAHMVRGFIWIGAALLFLTGLRYLELAEATALAFAAPVFITALSALVLKETVGWRRWTAVLVGFAGVLIVVRPGSAAFQAASLFPVATAFVYAVLMISARWVDKRDSMWTLMLYLVISGTLISALAMPFAWRPIAAEHWWLFLGIALFGTMGVTMITQAFRMAPASVVAPLDYTALVWSTLLGWMFWGEMPDFLTYAGAAVIIASGIYIVWREGKLRGQ